MSEISAEVKQAYRHVKSGDSIDFRWQEFLVNALCHERAMRLKAEYWRAHDDCKQSERKNLLTGFVELTWNCADERHSWKDADWKAETERQLSYEG